MIISLRGASGSGKSTIVRAIFMQYTRHRPKFMDGRKKPYYVIHGLQTIEIRSSRCLVVPGHYEIGNGGVDTLDSLGEAYAIARWADNMRWDVLMEGKCMSDGVPNVEKLHVEKRDVRVVHINTSVEECHASVIKRGHMIARASIEKTHAKILRNMEQFKCKTFSGSRTECQHQVETWLGLSSSG